MTRAEQPTVVTSTSGALAADSRERAVRSLLRFPPLRRLWNAQFAGGVGDSLALLVLLLLSLQAAVAEGSFGGGYRGAALAVAAVIAARLLATLLFGAVLLGPVTSLIAPAGPLDRRWTMLGADGVRAGLLVVAPLWLGWTGNRALAFLLISAFLIGVAERVWTAVKDSTAPALLPAPALEGSAVRPLPDHYDALRRLSLRTSFVSLPFAAAALLAITLIGNLLGAGIDWFHQHQAALGSFLAAALFAGSATILWFLELPGAKSPRVRSPLEGLRRPRGADGGPDTGRTGAIPVLVLACAAVAGAVAAAVGVAALQAVDLGGGPVAFGLLVLALSGGPVIGIRAAVKVLPGFSRRRLLALSIALTGLALLAAGLVPDPTTVLLLVLLAGVCAGIAANTGHSLLDQETEEARRPRTTDHLHAVVRVTAALGAVAAPLLAAGIGPHRLEGGGFVFAHGGAAFTLMLVGALLLPVGAIVLGKTDDRHGVPFRRDLMDVLRGGDPEQAPAATGFFIAFEGGDGAGKSTQVRAVAEWIRSKGHEVVVTREPGATPIGQRLRAILLDVSSAGLSDRAEALLYAADRAEHVDSVVQPALARGAVVITDRYIDSSVAYQGAGRDLSPTEIARINRWATGGLVPHLTVLLDVSPETARERFTEAPDRLESEPMEFHNRVRTGFLTLAAADPSRYLVVDAGQAPEDITTVVRHRLDQVLPLSASEIEAREQARKAAEEEARRKAEEEAARKAEEARLERERQEQLAKLRAEEEERKRREAEEARIREEARLAEEARQRAEEARRQAEEERKRREAEERTRAAEQERLRKQAEEEARLRAEAEERRLEKQRKAEEALLKAEQARVAKEAAAAAAAAAAASAATEADAASASASASASTSASEAPTVERPSLRPSLRKESPQESPEERRTAVPAGSSEETQTVQTPSVHRPDPRTVDHTTGVSPVSPDSSDTTPTVERPRVDPRASDETEVLPPVWPVAPPAAPQRVTWGVEPSAQGPQEREEPQGPQEPSRESEETAVLPQPPVADAATAVTEILPPVRPEERSEDPADRVPDWMFRPEEAEEHADAEKTREMPRVVDEGAAAKGRRRPGWAEEASPAAASDEDGPTLADELLGPRPARKPRRGDDENDRRGRGRGGR
ncbi:dTMP kinase [Streptomyces klenkii]|uniref:dTMP kinase n=1 Tax=Streptomyces klenkii TaxID=1420899 RepID=UPI0036E1F7E5